MPTTKGTRTRGKDVRKRAAKLDEARIVELLNEEREDGTYLTHQEIADKMGCSRPAVTRAIQRIPPWKIKRRSLEDFKRDRADILAQAQQLLFQYIDKQKLDRASLSQIVTSIGILQDKERLERGQATAHHAHLVEGALDAETKRLIQEAIAHRTQKLLEQARSAEPDGNSGDSETSQ